MNDFTIIITANRVQITFPSGSGRIVPLPAAGRPPVAVASGGNIDVVLPAGRYTAVMVRGGRDLLRKDFEVAGSPVDVQPPPTIKLAAITGRRGGDRGYTIDERIALLSLTDTKWIRDFHSMTDGPITPGEREQADRMVEYQRRGIGTIVTVTPPVVKIGPKEKWPAQQWQNANAIAEKIRTLYPASKQLSITLINEPEHEWPEGNRRCRYWATKDWRAAVNFAAIVARRLEGYSLATPCLTTRPAADYIEMARIIAPLCVDGPLFEFVDLHVYTASITSAANALTGARDAADMIGAAGVMLSECGLFPSMFGNSEARMLAAWPGIAQTIAGFDPAIWALWLYSTSANPAFQGTPALIAPNLAGVTQSALTEYGRIFCEATGVKFNQRAA
jgi:hypothetical protein